MTTLVAALACFTVMWAATGRGHVGQDPGPDRWWFGEAGLVATWTRFLLRPPERLNIIKGYGA